MKLHVPVDKAQELSFFLFFLLFFSACWVLLCMVRTAVSPGAVQLLGQATVKYFG